MFSDAITRYVDAISHTRKGLRVLIIDDFVIEQLAFLEIVRHYLPESTANALDQHELEEELNQDQHTYDLIILEERLLLNEADKLYVKQLRRKHEEAKIALFIDRENSHQLQTMSQLSDIDILFTKCTTVEAIAEKLCLTFQESQ